MMKTVTTAQMKSIDETAIHALGIPSLELMEHAAAYVADAAAAALSAADNSAALIVCGTGNNGGDGLACARLLSLRGFPVTVFLAGDPEKYTHDSAANARKLADLSIPVIPYSGQPLPECGCIVDAIFGFGLNREVTGIYRRAIEAINASPAPVIACDIPSGLNGDTGLPMGTAVKAARTVSFTCAKQGLLMPGAGIYVGALTVADIGIPASLTDAIPE